MCFNYRRPFFLLPSRIYKWSVQAIYCQKHKTKNSHAAPVPSAIDKKRFPNPRENSISKIRGNFAVYILENNRIVKKNECLKFI
jgi:hypothetical protein